MGDSQQETERDQDQGRPRSCGGRAARQLKCIYTNIEGVNTVNKSNLLSIVIKEESPHVLFLTETKLCSMDTASVYFDTFSYIVYRKDRVRTRGGGEVAILVRKDVESTDMQDAVWRDVEAAACVVILSSKRILLGCIYNATPEYND